MNKDPSNRVRIHAWQAVQAIVGPEQSARRFPISIPQHETLILISEDLLKMQEDLAATFGPMGFRIEFASDEAETMENAIALKPQAIITDNQKGTDNLSGLNMTFDLSRQEPLRETVLFMLTADFVEPCFCGTAATAFCQSSKPA